MEERGGKKFEKKIYRRDALKLDTNVNFLMCVIPNEDIFQVLMDSAPSLLYVTPRRCARVVVV